MDINSDPGNSQKKDPIWEPETNHHAHSSEWIGAVIRYLLLLGNKDFNEFYTKKERNKNSILGTVIKLSLFFLVIYLVFRFRK